MIFYNAHKPGIHSSKSVTANSRALERTSQFPPKGSAKSHTDIAESLSVELLHLEAITVPDLYMKMDLLFILAMLLPMPERSKD